MEVTKKKVRSKRKGGKPKKVFDPKSRSNPLSSLFKEPTQDRQPSARPSAIKSPAKQAQKPLKPKRERDFKIVDEIQPFQLFASYHLGVTEKDGYKPQNIHDIARRFNTSPTRINQALEEYEMDAETVLNTDFDMGLAQLDIKVAPKGVSKIELAKNLYEEFREAPRVIRDWKAEIMNDAEENRKIFEKLK